MLESVYDMDVSACSIVSPSGPLLVKNMFCSRRIQQHNYHCGLFCLGSLGQEMKHEMNSVASGWASWIWSVPTQWLGPVPGHLFAFAIKLFLLVCNEYCQLKLQVIMSSDLNSWYACISIFYISIIAELSTNNSSALTTFLKKQKIKDGRNLTQRALKCFIICLMMLNLKRWLWMTVHIHNETQWVK